MNILKLMLLICLNIGQPAIAESLESSTTRNSCELAWSAAARFCAEPAPEVKIPPESDFERRANVYGWVKSDTEFRLERCQRYVTNCQKFCTDPEITDGLAKVANNKENCDLLDATYLKDLKLAYANATALSTAANTQRDVASLPPPPIPPASASARNRR